MEAENFLSRHIIAVLEQLTERGYDVPIYMAAVAVNGSTLVGSFTGESFETFANHCFDGGFRLPINMMFVDAATGNAARVVIAQPDQEDYTIN